MAKKKKVGSTKSQMVPSLYGDQARAIERNLKNIIDIFFNFQTGISPATQYRKGTPVRAALDIIDQELKKPAIQKSLARMIVAAEFIDFIIKQG